MATDARVAAETVIAAVIGAHALLPAEAYSEDDRRCACGEPQVNGDEHLRHQAGAVINTLHGIVADPTLPRRGRPPLPRVPGVTRRDGESYYDFESRLTEAWLARRYPNARPDLVEEHQIVTNLLATVEETRRVNAGLVAESRAAAR